MLRLRWSSASLHSSYAQHDIARGTTDHGSQYFLNHSRSTESAASASLFEFQHDNFRIRSQSQRRSPGSHSARGKDLHLPDSAQAIDKLAVDATRHPTPGNELSQVC